jgi:ribosome-binding factor A
MASLGIERLQELIRAKVATMMIRDVSDPRLGMVTITKVRLSRDLETCVVSWSTLDEGPKRKRTEAALESARGYVRREVAAILNTRKAPRIDFAFDPSVEGAARVSDLIDRAAREDAERRRAREGTPPQNPS